MAAEDTTQTATTSTDDHKKIVRRQLNGTSFLTLEHLGYFVLVVLMPVLLLLGISAAMQLWQNNASSSGAASPLVDVMAPILNEADTSIAVLLAAAFVVLAPLMYMLRQRTGAEYAKRSGYTKRVAYKLPVYSALALLAALTIGAFVTMLGIFLNSLVTIGVNGANIGQMYTGQFLPALLAFAIFGMAAWYAMWFAKGKDVSKVFVNVIGLLAAVMAIALFVTTLTVNHSGRGTSTSPVQPQPYSLPGNGNYAPY